MVALEVGFFIATIKYKIKQKKFKICFFFFFTPCAVDWKRDIFGGEEGDLVEMFRKAEMV